MAERELDIAGEDEGKWFAYLIEDTAGLKPPYRLLDMGCGNGAMAREFQELGIDTYGVDLRDVIPQDPTRFFIEDARHTHFEDSIFDAVVENAFFDMLWCITHTPEIIPDVILEAKRVLRADGVFMSFSAGFNPEEMERLGFEYLSANRSACDRSGFHVFRLHK